jgi:hypothetical protein
MAYGKFSEISRSRIFEEIAGSIVFTGKGRLVTVMVEVLGGQKTGPDQTFKY